ncbi:DUF805 domain-containing protein [Aquamicrobium segne]|uniref:DUF805 domain-containing protein n=1 Tax=Aquamicrobium segne TaxID=469547 RepID=A0ABW0GSR2_9HYPH
MTGSQRIFWLFFGTSGRISRRVYVMACALSYMARFFTAYQFVRYSTETEPSTGWAMLMLAAILASLWSNVMLSIKRLHDCNRPGGWAISTLLLDILAVGVLAFMSGTPGPNQYGNRTDSPH